MATCRWLRLTGIQSDSVKVGKDAIEFFLAGATAVAVGTATFTDPGVVVSVHDGLVAYCERHGFASVSELTGALA